MAQIIRITSEALQATIRRLLPSQQGFGEDLQASNVIQPIIDLTPSAEGSELRDDLASAIAFGSATAFECQNNTVNLANSPGFYRVTGGVFYQKVNGASSSLKLQITDGLSTKEVYQIIANSSSVEPGAPFNLDLTFFLDTGETLSAVSSANAISFAGSYRQIADRYGNIVNPVGFTFE